MAYSRPALSEIIERKITDLESRLSADAARLRRSFFNALLRASAAIEHGLYGFIQYISKQVVPSLADEDYLKEHADWNGVPRLKAAAAVGNILVTGNGSIPAGTILQRADGVQYSTDNETAIVTSGNVAATSLSAGQAGNAVVGAVVSFVSPIPGIQSNATVAGEGFTGGTDIESIEAWRARFQEKVQSPPHGGALHDYIKWSKEVPGVTRVWPLANWLGAGTVGVFFVRDDDVSLIPSTQEVEAVQEKLDAERPVTANVTVIAPEAAAQNMTIAISPNSVTVQEAITAELADLFLRSAEVEDGTGSGVVLISQIREAVSIASGENDNSVVSPTANITPTVGQIATLGTITFESL